LLLVHHSGAWGTVCDDGFDEASAQVVCKELGYPAGKVVKTDAPEFCAGSGFDILMDDVKCSGSESRLEDCTHAAWGVHNCAHNEDVGVKCYSTRLAGDGATATRGRLEVYHDGKWGTVCDDSFNAFDAQVACRQLGFPFGRVADISTFGQGSGDIWMDDVECSGSESRLEQCTHSGWGNHNCGHNEDVAIQCWSTRLMGEGATSSQGRLEVYHAGEWGTVCDDGFGSEDAQVVCRELGYAHGIAMEHSNFGEGSGRIWLDEVACTGTEERLEDCPRNSWGENDCSHSEDVGIQCHDTIRLAGEGAAANQGRLEVYHAGEWGTVCDDRFGSEDAAVVCRQLGYSHGMAVETSNFAEGSGRIWLDEVACTGTEKQLEDCQHNSWGENDCSHSEDVGIICHK